MAKYDVYKTPLKIGKLTLDNRFVVAPMSMGCFYGEDGGFNEQATQYFAARAKGGFGLIITGAIGVDYQVDPYSATGPIPLQVGQVWIDDAKKFVDEIHASGAKVFAQLTLGLGRNYPGLPAPSECIVYGTTDQKSPALTKEQIKLKISQYIDTAKMVKEAGFDGIEVHAMHWGYLLDQFGMSFFNHRTDEYGGCLENRLRCAKEIVEGVHEVCGSDYPVGMRLGLQTYIKDVNKATLTGKEEVGRTLEEGIEIAKLLEKYGYDFLDVDTGTYDSFYYAEPPMYMPQGFMIDIAAKAKAVVKIPVIAGGRMQAYDAAAKAIEEGKIDGVALGRQSLADPEFPNKLYQDTPEKIRPCLGCNLGCWNRVVGGQGGWGSCAVNPQCARESIDGLKPGDGKKKIVIIGGGVAGMETARTATLRGYVVTLFEKSDHLGGHLIEAGAHSFKSEVQKLNEWYQRELKELNVCVKLGQEPCAECVKAEHPDAIVLAIGSIPSQPDIPGLDKAILSLDAIQNPQQLGEKIVIVGGGLVGCELALDEALKGKDVTVVEALDHILSSGIPAPTPNAQMLGDLFEAKNVTVLTGHKLVQVTEQGVVLENTDGTVELEADSVVSAIGFAPRESLKNVFSECGAPIYEIGDAVKAATIMNAVWEGYALANQL